MEINITVENNQNNEQITDIKDEQKLKDILGETKSQEDNSPKIENENIEKNNDNDIMIKELEKIDEQDEEQNEDQKEEINNNSQPDIKENSESNKEKKEQKEKFNIENIINNVIENNKKAAAARSSTSFYNIGSNFMNNRMRSTKTNFFRIFFRFIFFFFI